MKLRYKDPEAETSKLLSQPLIGPVSPLTTMPEDFRFASAVAAFGMVLRKSAHAEGATFGLVRELAKEARDRDPNGHRAEFLELVEAADRLSPKAAAAKP